MSMPESGAGLPQAGPILAPSGASPASSSSPDVPLEDGRYHIYDTNPVPWWLAVLWVAFFVFAAAYLIVNLLE